MLLPHHVDRTVLNTHQCRCRSVTSAIDRYDMIDICVVLCASISVSSSTMSESGMGSAQAWPAAPRRNVLYCVDLLFQASTCLSMLKTIYSIHYVLCSV